MAGNFFKQIYYYIFYNRQINCLVNALQAQGFDIDLNNLRPGNREYRDTIAQALYDLPTIDNIDKIDPILQDNKKLIKKLVGTEYCNSIYNRTKDLAKIKLNDELSSLGLDIKSFKTITNNDFLEKIKDFDVLINLKNILKLDHLVQCKKELILELIDDSDSDCGELFCSKIEIFGCKVTLKIKNLAKDLKESGLPEDLQGLFANKRSTITDTLYNLITPKNVNKVSRILCKDDNERFIEKLIGEENIKRVFDRIDFIVKRIGVLGDLPQKLEKIGIAYDDLIDLYSNDDQIVSKKLHNLITTNNIDKVYPILQEVELGSLMRIGYTNLIKATLEITYTKSTHINCLKTNNSLNKKSEFNNSKFKETVRDEEIISYNSDIPPSARNLRSSNSHIYKNVQNNNNEVVTLDTVTQSGGGGFINIDMLTVKLVGVLSNNSDND